MRAILAICSFITEMVNELKSSKKLNEFTINNNYDLFKKKGVENSRYTRLLRNGKYKFNTRQNSSNYKIIANRNTIQNYLRDSSQISLEKNNKDTIIFKAKNRKKLSDNITKYRHTINFNRDNSNLFEFFNNKNPNFPLNYYLYGYFMNKLIPKKKY
jgi:hypothetical protein